MQISQPYDLTRNVCSGENAIAFQKIAWEYPMVTNYWHWLFERNIFLFFDS